MTLKMKLIYAIFVLTKLVLALEECDNNWDYKVRCLPEGNGYANYACVSPLHNNAWMEGYKDNLVWHMDEDDPDEVLCSSPNSACRCYEKIFWNDYEQGCECYNPTRPGVFPETGIIRWSGLSTDMDYDLNVFKANLSGEVQKTKSGNYLKREWSNDKTLASFEIRMQRSDGLFDKYTGDTSNKTCTIKREVSGQSLMSLWPKFSSDKDVTLISESEKTDANTSRQEWKKNIDHGEWEETWSWVVQHDYKEDVALPVEYHFKKMVWIEDMYTKYDLYYDFEHVKEDEEMFQLSDYCTNA